MATAPEIIANSAARHYIARLNEKELFIHLDWASFLGIEAPYPDTGFQRNEVTARYRRNGYDWDIHGTLYTPDREALPGYSMVLIHRGGVNELDFHATPDKRPGLAAVLASQGFQVLTPTYPGLWPPGGKWTAPVTRRKPYYLLDRQLEDQEIEDRLLKSTYQVYMHGIGLLVEQCLGGRKLFAHGHSTGGPMAVDLHEYLTTAKVAGILGWGSGGSDGWILQWRQANEMPLKPMEPGAGAGRQRGLTDISYRTVEGYRNAAGYEDLPELTPWGRMEQRFELVRDTTPMFNPPLQNVSHLGDIETLKKYQRATGLPLEEYAGHVKQPDPEFLRGIKALLLVGENDKNHWTTGGKLPEQRQDGFVARLYAEKGKGAHLVVVPKFTHMGHWALHNEKIAYLWLWAVKSGYFGNSADAN